MAIQYEFMATLKGEVSEKMKVYIKNSLYETENTIEDVLLALGCTERGTKDYHKNSANYLGVLALLCDSEDGDAVCKEAWRSFIDYGKMNEDGAIIYYNAAGTEEEFFGKLQGISKIESVEIVANTDDETTVEKFGEGVIMVTKEGRIDDRI